MAYHVCRRLILFLDGTWNEDGEDNPATNIVYLRERLFWGLQERHREDRPGDRKDFEALDGFTRKGVSGLVFDGFEYIVYYDRGVGTGPYLDPLKGGIFGDGLDQKIREAYRFLSYWYRPGDEILIFGFSRGAFTARSLAGYLQSVGLLRCEHCTIENEARAWKYYRTSPGDRLSGEWNWFRLPKDDSKVHDARYARVRALCVFDTVGALGVPAEGFRRINRSKYEFHDTEVNSLVDIGLHAVAIDEPRPPFEPAMWTKPKFKQVDPTKSPTEQVWFPGAHSDIGGGYVKWTEVREEDKKLVGAGLSFLPLAWMIQRLKRLIVEIPPIADKPDGPAPSIEPKRDAPLPFYDLDLLEAEGAGKPPSAVSGQASTAASDQASTAASASSAVPATPARADGHSKFKAGLRDLVTCEQHKPWAAASVVRPDALRIINQLLLPSQGSAETSGRVAYADPLGEAVHICVLKRFGKTIAIDKNKAMNLVDKINVFKSPPQYRPENLIAVIPYIAATYLRHHRINDEWCKVVQPVFTWKELSVVGWNGLAFDPEKKADVECVLKLLPSPEAIKLTRMLPAMEAVLDPRVKDWPYPPPSRSTAKP
jgi:hypothetical protein